MAAELTNTILINDITLLPAEDGAISSVTVRLPNGDVLEIFDDGRIDFWVDGGRTLSHSLDITKNQLVD